MGSVKCNGCGQKQELCHDLPQCAYTCKHCGFIRCQCEVIHKLAWEARLANLGRCLREVGALYAAFRLGWKDRDNRPGHHQDVHLWREWERECWRPGCGRAVSGWEGWK